MSDYTVNSGMSITLGEMLAVASRAMDDQFNDEDGRLTYPDPVDYPEQHDSAMRVVKRAIRRIVGEKSDWNWMRQVVELDIEADTYQYDMPWFFAGQVLGPVTFSGTDAPMREIRVVTLDQIELARGGQGAAQTQDPTIVSFERVNDRTAPGARNDPAMWRAVFWPTPASARTVLMAVRAEPQAITDVGHRFIAGSENNRMLEAAVQYEAAVERNPEKLEMFRGEYADAVRKAVELDNRSKPRNGGRLEQTMGRSSRWISRVNSVSVNGVLT